MTVPLTWNAGRSVYNGIDINGAWVPNSSLRFDASVSYLDAEIKDVGDITVGAKKGNTPIYAPKLSGSVGAAYRLPIGGGMLTLGGDLNYKDKIYFDLANNNSQGPVALVNLYTRYQFGSGGNHWTVFGSVNNLFDREYFTNAFNPLSPPGPGAATVGAPRMYRVGVAYNY